ncbi:hypothetical protein PINS_up006123 [Pythium insidiosum]|nr:hypothetical protein PINS_up006123 [Pythium insidiosum]
MSRVQAKLRGLAAVYGLNRATRPPDKSPGEEVNNHQLRQEMLEARRRLYRDHFRGLQAVHPLYGRPKLDVLIDAAVEARRVSRQHALIGIGVAVLLSSRQVFTASYLADARDSLRDLCAERRVLLKVTDANANASVADVAVVEAMVICSDQRDGLLPAPCGSCRELMAEHGDFPVYLINADLDSQETRSFELFPAARHSSLATQQQQQDVPPQISDKSVALPKTATAKTPSLPEDIRDWTAAHVAQWLETTVQLPQYRHIVELKGVDGAMLPHLADSDLQLLLGIAHPLHRQRILRHIDRLRDRELLTHGVDLGQLSDYLAVLDRDRLEVVSQLKATFDRLDRNRDGVLDFQELRRALKELGCDASTPIVEQLLQSIGADVDSASPAPSPSAAPTAVTFPQFVDAFSRLAQRPIADSERTRVTLPVVDLEALRRTFERADTNQSGTLDANELVALFVSLGQSPQDATSKSREWMQRVDLDRDARVSFAEFVLRYAQVQRLDLSSLETLYDAAPPFSADGADAGNEARSRPRAESLVEHAIATLFPHVSKRDRASWCASRPWTSSCSTATASSETATETATEMTRTIGFADLVLAVLQFHNAQELRAAQHRELRRKLGTRDPLAHRSRIVQLQQSGHVRLCQRPAAATSSTTTARRSPSREQCRRRSRSRREERKSETEEEDDDDDEADDRTRRRRLVDATFDQFLRARSRRSEHSDAKREEKEEEEAEQQCLGASEAAQALLELGLVCSREQLLRFLTREGFGVQRTIDRRAFHALFLRLQVLQRSMQLPRQEEDEDEKDDDPKPKRSTSRGQRHDGVRQDQDHRATILDRRRQREELEELARGRSRSRRTRELAKIQREGSRSRSKRHRHDKSEGETETGESSSSSSSSSRSGRRGRRRVSKSRSRSLSRGGRRHRRSKQQQRSPSSSSSSSSSTSSSSRSSSRLRASTGAIIVGDRVVLRPTGAQPQRSAGANSKKPELGTVLRVYRDYFVADLQLDSGVRVKNVELSRLRRARPQDERQQQQQQQQQQRFVVGSSVRVAHLGTKNASRRGTVLRCRTNGTYDVVVMDAGAPELLQRVAASALLPLARPIVYQRGTRVTVKRRHEYLRGRVVLCRTNGTYDVELRRASGKSSPRVERRVAWELLAPDEDEEDEEDEDDVAGNNSRDERDRDRDRDRDRRRRRDRPEIDSEDDGKQDDDTVRHEKHRDPANDGLREGARVEARFQGLAQYFPGRITRVHADDSVDIQYDDGDRETRVPRRLVRVLAADAHQRQQRRHARDSDSEGEQAYADDDFEA